MVSKNPIQEQKNNRKNVIEQLTAELDMFTIVNTCESGQLFST